MAPETIVYAPSDAVSMVFNEAGATMAPETHPAMVFPPLQILQ